MQIDAKLLKQERTRRAWSQEHLAQVAGLGLRTVQRMESAGTASNKSIAAVATVMKMTITDFVGDRPAQKSAFDTVRAIGMALPDVKDASSRVGLALKCKGQMLACEAIDRSAETDTLMVTISVKRREALLAQDPATYYLTAHYAPYPAILVRLARIKRAALGKLLAESREFICEQAR